MHRIKVFNRCTRTSKGYIPFLVAKSYKVFTVSIVYLIQSLLYLGLTHSPPPLPSNVIKREKGASFVYSCLITKQKEAFIIF